MPFGLWSQNESSEITNTTYQKIISKADSLYNEELFLLAKERYIEALEIKSTDIYLENQITIINKILDSNQKYEELINHADSLFLKHDYETARVLYKEAIELRNSKEYPKKQIELTISIQKARAKIEVKKQYDKVVSVADKKFNEGNYEKALSLYKRAIEMNPTDEYVLLQIEKTEKKMKND